MNPDLTYMFSYLNTLLLSEHELTHNRDLLIGFHKDSKLIAYGIFEYGTEELVYKSGKKKGQTYKVNTKIPIKVFLIDKDEQNEYVYDELENHPDYNIKKDFKF